MPIGCLAEEELCFMVFGDTFGVIQSTTLKKMCKQIRIVIELIGTEGQLDKPESEYKVLNLEDQAENAKQQILKVVDKYSKYGFTLIMAVK